MGPAWDTAKDGIMSEEDYPYERKVLFDKYANMLDLVCFMMIVLMNTRC